MKRILFFLLIVPLLSKGQLDFQKLKMQSAQTFLYKVSSKQVEDYIKLDSINIDAFNSATPYIVFPKDSVDETKLPIGHYLLISVEDNRVVAEIIGVSDLYMYTINNRHRVQLLVRTKEGSFVNDAKVWVNDKEAPYNSSSGSYWVKQKSPDDATVKIYTPSDTLFASLSSNESYEDNSISQQRWANLKKTRLFHIAAWVPRKIGSLFGYKHYEYKPHYYGDGTIIFNQPKYKLTDTVKLKAYAFTKKWKRYNSVANIHLQYYSNDVDHDQLLTKLKPYAPGAFIFQFPLSDTLETDRTYKIVLQDKKNRILVSKSFKIEDYLLDEVSKPKLRSVKDVYYPNDTLHFYASSTDANGLSLLDATAKLILTSTTIDKFYNDTLYVPDTLFTSEQPLKTEGETEFTFPASSLPNADLAIHAELIIKNSNNEWQEAEKGISYATGKKELSTDVKEDTLRAAYRINGKVEPAEGIMIMKGGIEKTTAVHFPLSIKIDPLAKSYKFYIVKNNLKIDSATESIDDDYRIELSRISIGDTLGFLLDNPRKIPVSFSVFFGNKMIAAGKDDKETITYKFRPSDKHRMYKVKWQYVWDNREQQQEQTIALLYKILNIQVNGSPSVFPGQKDTIHINVEDYKNKPAQNVNLTAVSYNSQFKKDINVHDPPYLVKYHNPPFLLYGKFEQDEAYFKRNYPLGKHIQWLTKFGLDSLTYYQMLFPSQPFKDFVTPLGEYTPQVSLHIADNGERQEVYLLYINNQLVKYNGVTEETKDAYSCFPGYAKFGIRLFNKYIETDSIYIQPFYKHDLFLDIAHLPAASVVSPMPDTLTSIEQFALSQSIWQLDNNSRTNYSFVWEADRLFSLSGYKQHLAGPFINGDILHFFSPGNFDISFPFEAGYEYNLSPKTLRLEKKSFLTKENIHLNEVASTQWILGDTIISPPLIHYDTLVYKPSLVTSYYYNYVGKLSGKASLQFTIPGDTLPQYIILYSGDTLKTTLVFNKSSMRTIQRIEPGNYSLLIVANDSSICDIPNLVLKADQTLCIHTEKYLFQKYDSLFDKIEVDQRNTRLFNKALTMPLVSENDDKQILPAYEHGNGNISGKVVDNKGGHGVPFVTVRIEGTKTGTAADETGQFSFHQIKNGTIKLVFSSPGYLSKEIEVNVKEGISDFINVTLEVTNQSLNNVVVTTALGIQRQERSLGYATVLRTDLSGNITTGLAAKVSGLEVPLQQPIRITLRGDRSPFGSNEPIYIIDGIVYNRLPSNVTPEMVADVTVLKGSEATSLYGSAAVNGAIVITTKTKTLRKQFRDYAFWQPQLFTDEKGNASFVVEYPDNITGWETFVLGMDKNRRMGKTVTYVKSYKPLLAQLSMPQFLIEGDTTELVGKSMNYTADIYSVNTTFTASANKTQIGQFTLDPKASHIDRSAITATASKDTITASFTLQTTTGFKDGEERKIPILPTGTEEAAGNFWVLQNDTTINYTATANSGKVELYAENNTLDILLDEIEYLKKYPYYCMEQTSSKLKGLLMEKKIKEALKQPFTDQRYSIICLEKFKRPSYTMAVGAGGKTMERIISSPIMSSTLCCLYVPNHQLKQPSVMVYYTSRTIFLI